MSDPPEVLPVLMYGILGEVCTLLGVGDALTGLDDEAGDVFRLLEKELRLGWGTIIGADLLYSSSHDRGSFLGLDPTIGTGAVGEFLPDDV